jgi:hypothetical protein
MEIEKVTQVTEDSEISNNTESYQPINVIQMDELIDDIKKQE